MLPATLDVGTVGLRESAGESRCTVDRPLDRGADGGLVADEDEPMHGAGDAGV